MYTLLKPLFLSEMLRASKWGKFFISLCVLHMVSMDPKHCCCCCCCSDSITRMFFGKLPRYTCSFRIVRTVTRVQRMFTQLPCIRRLSSNCRLKSWLMVDGTSAREIMTIIASKPIPLWQQLPRKRFGPSRKWRECLGYPFFEFSPYDLPTKDFERRHDVRAMLAVPVGNVRGDVFWCNQQSCPWVDCSVISPRNSPITWEAVKGFFFFFYQHLNEGSETACFLTKSQSPIRSVDSPREDPALRSPHLCDTNSFCCLKPDFYLRGRGKYVIPFRAAFTWDICLSSATRTGGWKMTGNRTVIMFPSFLQFVP